MLPPANRERVNRSRHSLRPGCLAVTLPSNATISITITVTITVTITITITVSISINRVGSELRISRGSDF